MPIQLEQLFEKLKLPITHIQPDLECEEYFGFNFHLGSAPIKFRKAKITPKKVGQFVTLWRRNAAGITEPFDIKDEFEFYMIYVEKDELQGLFFFPKSALAAKQILINDGMDGKRGFRVYPDWDLPEDKQAAKTQAWQTKFFIDLASEADIKKAVNLSSSITV